MRALTVWRPVDEPMSTGEKPIENRPKPPPRTLLGQVIAIHAGKMWDEHMATFCYHAGYQHQLSPAESDARAMSIVGVARIVGWLDTAVPSVHSTRERVVAVDSFRHQVQELQSSPWWIGPVGILLIEATAIEPVPCKGMQGYWTVPRDVEAIVAERVREAYGRPPARYRPGIPPHGWRPKPTDPAGG